MLVVVVLIGRNPGAVAKQRVVAWIFGHMLGRTRAADMLVQADNPVGLRHHHMQVMADHKHRHAGFGPDLFEQRIKAALTGLVEALGRLIQN